MFRAMQSHGVRNDGLLSASNSEMGLKTKKLSHRKSASYDDSTLKGAMRGGSGVAGVTEEMRRERRRSEAKNAIEVRSLILRNAGCHRPPFFYVAWEGHEREYQAGR